MIEYNYVNEAGLFNSSCWFYYASEPNVVNNNVTPFWTAALLALARPARIDERSFVQTKDRKSNLVFRRRGFFGPL